jgi:hypothetical protein
MKYSCDHCSYETDKKANYLRHLNRKFRCNKNDNKVKAKGPDVMVESSGEDHTVMVKNSEVMDEYPKVKGQCKSDLSCKDCNKTFSNLRKLRNHKDVCRGKLSILQCEICHKFFSCKQSKYEHKRYVLCYPPPPDSEPPENNTSITKESKETTVSNITSLTNSTNHSHNNNQNTTNSHNNTVNNIINFNSFGDEGIEQLGKFLSGQKDDSRIIERMRQLGKKNIYGVRDMQNDIFFNPDNPEGFSIIKPEKYGSSVRVRNSEGEFEYREFQDIRDPLLDYMEKYIEFYNKTRNKYNVKFRDPKERRILHNFFKIMNDNLEIYLGGDLKEELNIKDSPPSNEEDEEKKYRQFDRVSLDNIHVQTKKYYKCKKGEFVLKEKEG